MVLAKYTAIFEKSDDGWWVASAAEIPGALTQGKTIEDARENLVEAVLLLMDTRSDEAMRGKPADAIVEDVLVEG